MKLTIAFIAFLFLSSCNQNKDLKEDLGDRVSAEHFEQVVVESWGNDDILSIKKSDFAYIEKVISINNGVMRPSLAKAMTITDIEDTAEVMKYHMVIQSEEIQDGSQSKLSSRERVLNVKKTSTSSQSLNQKNVEDEIQTTPFEGFLDTLSLCRYPSVECYKLKVEPFVEAVPPLMQETGKNCRSFADCTWKGTQVSFVVRISYKDEETGEMKKQNNIISYKIVPEMPYLFKMVEYCFQGLSEYQGQKFPVKVCTQVKDAIKGP